MNMHQHMNIGTYLLAALQRAGVDHIFGIPGDYILGFYDQLAHSGIQHIGTTREDSAAFAADGYARQKGLGALAVTYGVGALNTINAIAGAYAESSPVVIISGSPGTDEIRDDPLLHHRFGPFDYQLRIFRRITAYAAVLDDPVLAFRQIDQAIWTAKTQKRPVYLELPRNRINTPGHKLPGQALEIAASDDQALREVVQETLQRLHRASRPVLIAGIELHRRRLQPLLKRFIDQTGLPVAATLTGKSVIAENHPQYLGIYEGVMSSSLARATVEQSDCALMLGLTLNDVDTGIFTTDLNPSTIIRASKGEVIISHHRYQKVLLQDFVSALASNAQPLSYQFETPAADKRVAVASPTADQPLTIEGLVQLINGILNPGLSIVCDTGDCLFASIELRVPRHSAFFASAFYTSMGFAVPAALGIQLAQPDRRCLVLVGDGASQMSGTELCTHARNGLAPIVIVFNNHGYNTERYILEGPFNDITEWRYDRIGELFGPVAGYDVRNEREFDAAIEQALADTQQVSVLNVHLRIDDPSPAMRRLGAHLNKKLQTSTDQRGEDSRVV